MMATSKHLIKQQDEVHLCLVGDHPICSRGIPEIILINERFNLAPETAEIEPSHASTLINAVFSADSHHEPGAKHAKNKKG
jgi:hypothetical protein